MRCWASMGFLCCLDCATAKAGVRGFGFAGRRVALKTARLKDKLHAAVSGSAADRAVVSTTSSSVSCSCEVTNEALQPCFEPLMHLYTSSSTTFTACAYIPSLQGQQLAIAGPNPHNAVGQGTHAASSYPEAKEPWNSDTSQSIQPPTQPSALPGQQQQQAWALH